MDYKKLIILYTLLFPLFHSNLMIAQNKDSLLLKKTSCDCFDAIKLNISQTTIYGLTQAPEGAGNVQEIASKNKHDKRAFEKEHHTAWYLLTINHSGELVFEVVPKDTTNDYDFLLYKYMDSSFCENVLNKKITPVRSNISRNDGKNKGITGLSKEATNEFYGQGLGHAFSKPIQVKKGEKYMLVLDNVYPNGKGHWIYFNFLKSVEIKGIVIDSDSLPIPAEIKLLDNKGKTVEETKSNKNGEYEIKTTLKQNIRYNLIFMNDSSFVSTETINTISLKNGNVFPNIKTVLPKLKKGGKYQLGNINFYGGLATLLPESYSSVESLYHLMKKNKKMIIQIEGHVNAAGEIGKPIKEVPIFQELSLSRAMTIYDYLQKKGISKERMTVIGSGATKMLFPFAKNEKEASANRRVEIEVVSINGE